MQETGETTMKNFREVPEILGFRLSVAVTTL
jgi:hypothetical protein